MKQKRFWTATFILAGVVFIGFAISVPHAHDVVQMKTASPAATVVPAVTLHDSFKKGVHTITGSLAAPNVCTLVTANAQLSGDGVKHGTHPRFNFSPAGFWRLFANTDGCGFFGNHFCTGTYAAFGDGERL